MVVLWFEPIASAWLCYFLTKWCWGLLNNINKDIGQGNFHLRVRFLFLFSLIQLTLKSPFYLLTHAKSPTTNCKETISLQQPISTAGQFSCWLILTVHTMVGYETGDQLPWGNCRDTTGQDLRVNRKVVPEKQKWLMAQEYKGLWNALLS